MGKLNVKVFSKGLFSSWAYLRTFNMVFDCGEGCATELESVLPGIDKIFITHTHGDHINGLPSLIGCRNTVAGTARRESGRAGSNKPLTIFYPKDNDRMQETYDFLFPKRIGENWLNYKINFTPIDNKFSLELAKNVFVEPVEMLHQKDRSTYGYVIYEMRSRLKEKYRNSNIRELLASGKVDKSDLNELYRYNKFAYLLDGYKILEPNKIRGCDDVIVDSTFLDEADRNKETPNHFSATEALRELNGCGVKNIFLAHISPRYWDTRIVGDVPFKERDNFVANKYLSILSSVATFDMINPYKINLL